MWDIYLAHGPLALFYFPFVIIVGNLVALNLFPSIVVATFSSSDKDFGVMHNMEGHSSMASLEAWMESDDDDAYRQQEQRLHERRASHSRAAQHVHRPSPRPPPLAAGLAADALTGCWRCCRSRWCRRGSRCRASIGR